MGTATAKKAVAKLWSATKSRGSAIFRGFSKAKMEISGRHERSVLEQLKKKGLRHSDLLFQAFRRVYFLYMAGYKHELVAAAQAAGERLTDIENSSVPLDVVKLFANSVCNECAKYGDFEKGKFCGSVQEFVTRSRMVKDRYDRESIVHDIYYAVLATFETYGTQWEDLVQAFRDGASQLMRGAVTVTDMEIDSRKKAAKALYLFVAQIRDCSKEAEVRKQKALKEAEDLLRKEKEKQLKFISGPSGPSIINDEMFVKQTKDKQI